jgi:hypothetical protein
VLQNFAFLVYQPGTFDATGPSRSRDVIEDIATEFGDTGGL